MKKVKFGLCLLILVGACSSFLFAAGAKETSPTSEEKVKITVWGPLENYSEAEKNVLDVLRG